MGEVVSWFPTSSEDRKKWEGLCLLYRYRIYDPDTFRNRFPGLLPNSLINKAHEIFVMASGSTGGIAYYMSNIMRRDVNHCAIDQEPFGLAFVGDEAYPSGCLLHHGDWPGRTTKYPPADFYNNILNSGLGEYYPIKELPAKPSGSIDELEVESQKEAFSQVVFKLKEAFEE